MRYTNLLCPLLGGISAAAVAPCYPDTTVYRAIAATWLLVLPSRAAVQLLRPCSSACGQMQLTCTAVADVLEQEGS